MKKLKHIRVLLGLMAFGLFCGPLNAQISEGGIPPSFAYPDVAKSFKTPVTVHADFDVKKQIELDQKEQDDMWGGTPLKIGKMLPVDLSVGNAGEWTTLPNGTKIWRLSIKAPGALAVMLYYDEFYIPEGGKLFIYNSHKTQVLGAYTTKTNPNNRRFATELVAGDELTLEYVAPSFPEGVAIRKMYIEPKLKISHLIYGYNNIWAYDENDDRLKTGFYKRSGACMINVNCEEGANWQDQKKGVAATVGPIPSQPGYVGLCSGSMVNNTAQDLTPYFLSAFHCYEDGGYVDMDQLVFYFHYEVLGCTNTSAEPGSKTMVGADILVQNSIAGGSDGSLLILKDAIPTEYDVYYNGWDRSNTPATSGVGIHHPAGDVKKISTYTAPAESATWNSVEGTGVANAHWNIIFAATANGHSVTEGGSSGSPMFNQNGLVVGTLSGGNSSCTNLLGRNLYGKLWYHWDQHSDANQHMKQYLDPINTGQITLDGTYIQGQTPVANFFTSSTNIYVFQTVAYTNRSAKAETFEWTFEGGTPASSTEEKPPIVTYNTPGIFETKLVINKGTAEEAEVAKIITVTEKGDNPVAPIANFALTKDILLQEDFSGTFPPLGWVVDNRGASTLNWIKGNLSEATPDPISPNQVAYHKWDDNNVAEGWLITKEITIPSIGATVEFYCVGGEQYQQNAWTYFYVIDKNDTEIELWNNGIYETEPNYVWANPTVDLSTYAGQTVRLAWRYYGQAGDASMIDGVIVYAVPDPDVKLTINVGDYVSPVDLSTGPPILYGWSFPGGEPETSVKEDPGKVRYMTPGTYDITLKVKNYRGEHTRTLTNAVTVNELIPVVAYETSVSYTRRENFGLFLPTGAEVDFTDKSLSYPTSWEWTLQGGEPASSTEQNPNGVKFNTEGEFDFRFKAINGGGDDEIAIVKGTKVGYTRDTVWNLAYGEKNSRTMYTYTYGYVTGTNTWDITSYAEKFDAPPALAGISGVKVNMLAAGTNSSHQLLVGIAKVGSDGLPGAMIATTTLPLSVVNQTAIADDKPTLVEFDVPVLVNEPFFVLVGDPTGSGGDFDSPGYTAAVVTSSVRGTEGRSTAYRFDSYYGKWESLSEIFEDFNASMDVAPVITYVQHEGIDAKKFVFKNIDPTVATVNMKTNLPWKATTDAAWIEIAHANGDGDGSFTFTVKDNRSKPRKAIVEVSAGTDLVDYILVVQVGPNPEDLTAVITDEDTGDIALTWETPNITLPYKLGDNIFDDVEDHSSFALDSPGEFIGWTYIDGDGGSPSKISYNGEDFPNANISSSFMVYSPSKTNPPITHEAFAPHSGKQFFACPKNYTGEANNDWLVSPELGYFGDFTFSFWAKSIFAPSYVERIRVAYSTAGNTAADFTNIVSSGSYESVPGTWTKYEFTIPANAKYVALNCVSNLAFMLLVDDIFIGTGDAPLSAYEVMPYTTGEAKFKEEGPRKVIKREYTDDEIHIKNNQKSSGKVLEIKNETTGEIFEVIQKVRVSKEEQLTPKFEAANKEDKQRILTEELNVLNDERSLPTAKLRYDGGANVTSIGFNTPADVPMEVAIRFTPADLLVYHDAKMKAVDVYLKNVPSDGIVLKVRQGDMVYRQQVSSLAADKFTRISLNKELRIDVSKDLYVGYEYVQRNKQYVAGVGSGPAVIGKGDLIGSDGDPLESLYELTGGQLNYNWNIALLIEDNKDVVGIEYNVYRDNALIATVDETMLEDVLATQNNACYEVSALYFGEAESTRSNASCVTLKSLLTIASVDVTRYVGEPNPNFEFTVTGDLLPGHTYSDVLDLCSAECLADELSGPGSYPITIKLVTHSDYRFAYQHGTLTVLDLPILNEAPVLTGTVVGDETIELSWTAVTAAASYLIYRDGVVLATVGELIYHDNTLAPSEYCYTVRGQSSSGIYSKLSNKACVTLAPAILNEAPVLTATVVGAETIELSWTTVTAAASYVIYRAEAAIDTVTTLNYADNALAPGEYCYTVKGQSGIGLYSELSNQVCATIAKHELTVGVQNATRYMGEPNPTFMLTYSGFVGNDTPDVLIDKPTASSEATLLSAAGTYPITVSGGQSSKYRFIYTSGTLTIRNRYDDVNQPLTNAFTPYERDGINDIFLPGASIEIVNRYGQHIFNGSNGWNGTRKNGQLVPPGTYYYKATLSGGRTLKGSVEVIKKK